MHSSLMPLRPCLECGRLSPSSRCDQHKRGSTSERGYGAEHERAKRQPEYRDATRCVTCEEPFTPDNPKTAGHAKAQRHGGTTADGIIPQCQDCNYGWRRTGT